MWWSPRIEALQSKQPAALRWLETFALFGIALAVRLSVGQFYGGMPSLTFYPVLLIVALVFGWKEATAVLVLSVAVGLYLFLPPGMYLQPVGWLIVGGMTVVIIGALKSLSQQLALANERQRVLFRELQHRIANTLHSVLGTLEIAERRIDTAPAEAKSILREQMRRISASARVHRRLNDPSLFGRGLKPILYDAVAAIIDTKSIQINIDVEDVGLSFDQMSTITMIVIEIANNAQKHVYERGLGMRFWISVTAVPQNRAILCVKDNGPGWSSHNTAHDDRAQGLTILQDLAEQLHGTLTINAGSGTEITVVFPAMAAGRTLECKRRVRLYPGSRAI